MNKAILNRKIQVLENALKDLRTLHNRTIDDIKKNVRCPECRKVMFAHAKKRNREWLKLQATLLGAFTPTDYSQEPHKLFEEEGK